MTDKLKESLSALIDGEASEIELHQLLRQFDRDESLKGTWMLYQQIRAVVRGENCLAGDQHLALHSRISEAIAAEHLPELTGGRPSVMQSRYFKPAAGLAVAASLVAAVFLGLQNTGVTDPGVIDQAAVPSAPGENSQVMEANDPAGQPALPPSFASLPAAATEAEPEDPFAEMPGGELGLRELDEKGQRRLRAYLNQHDRLVRMNPNARMVIFENTPSN